MDHISFSPLEETISFYTRNDFAILNHLLVGNYEELWLYASLAYDDNRNIVHEYETGVRSIESDYDIKWLRCLKKRMINGMDQAAKEAIVRNAQNDISNILDAMCPAKEDMLLYRTAWIDVNYAAKDEFAYSREYKALKFDVGDILEIKAISSCALTPYRENDDVGNDFYRYEIWVQRGMPVLELDQFITHNEDGEVLLPPMKCRVKRIRNTKIQRCKGIVDLEYVMPLS